VNFSTGQTEGLSSDDGDSGSDSEGVVVGGGVGVEASSSEVGGGTGTSLPVTTKVRQFHVRRLKRWSQHSLLPSSLLLLDVPGGPVFVWGGSDAARERRHQRDALKCARMFGEPTLVVVFMRPFLLFYSHQTP
jgi:hypothetical protein